MSWSFMGVKRLILTIALVFRERNIVGASGLNMVVMTDTDSNCFQTNRLCFRFLENRTKSVVNLFIIKAVTSWLS